MAFNIAELFVTLGLVDKQFKDGATKATFSLSKMGKQAAATAAGFIGAGSISAAVSAAGRAIVGAVKDFAALEKAMAEVGTLVDNSTVDMTKLRDEVLALSSQYGEDPGGLANALYQAVSAGVDASDAMGFLDVASRAAAAGVTDTRTAVDALTSILNAYGQESDQAEKAADILFATIKAGKTTMAEIAPVLGGIAPLAFQAGISMEEMSAALATLTLTGTPTAEAATELRGVMASLVKPTDQARAATEALKFQWDTSIIEAKGLKGALDDLQKATQGDLEIISKIIPEIRGLGGVLKLAGGNADDFAKIINDTTDSTGAMNEAFEEMSLVLSFQWGVLAREFSNIGQAILNDLLPYLQTTLDVVLKVYQGLRLFGEFDVLKGPHIAAVKMTLALRELKQVTEELDATAIEEIDTRDKQAKQYALAIENLTLLEKIYGKNISIIKKGQPAIAERMEILHELIALRGKQINAIVEGDEEEGESAKKKTAVLTEEEKKEIERQAARIALFKKVLREKTGGDKKEVDSEKEKNRKLADEARELAKIERTRLTARRNIAEAIHKFDQQVRSSQIERLEAIVDDERRTNQQRLEAAEEMYALREERAEAEVVFLTDLALEKRDNDIKELKAMEGDTKDALKAVEVEYIKTAQNIGREFERRIEKETVALFEIKFKLQKGTLDRLFDEMGDNWRTFFKELGSGSTAAWSGVVMDGSDALTQIGNMIWDLPDEFDQVMNSVANIISGALTGGPFQIISGALGLIGTALRSAGDESRRAAEEERRAAEESRRAADQAVLAAKAFLKASGREELTLLTYEELGDRLDETSEQMADFFATFGFKPQAEAAALGMISQEDMLELLRRFDPDYLERLVTDLAALGEARKEEEARGIYDGPAALAWQEARNQFVELASGIQVPLWKLAEFAPTLIEARADPLFADLIGIETRIRGLLEQPAPGGLTPAEQLAAAARFPEAEVAIERMPISEAAKAVLRGEQAVRFREQFTPAGARFEQIQLEATKAQQNIVDFEAFQAASGFIPTQERDAAMTWIANLGGDPNAIYPILTDVDEWIAAGKPTSLMDLIKQYPAQVEVAGGVGAGGVSRGARGVGRLTTAQLEQMRLPTELLRAAIAYAGGPAVMTTTDEKAGQLERGLDLRVQNLKTQFALNDIDAYEYSYGLNRLAREYDTLSKSLGLSDTFTLKLRKKAFDLLQSSANATANHFGDTPQVPSFAAPTGPSFGGPAAAAGMPMRVELFPGFAVTPGTEGSFIDALNRIAGGVGLAQLLPEEMDINIHITTDGEISEGAAAQISIGLADAVKNTMRSQGVVA